MVGDGPRSSQRRQHRRPRKRATAARRAAVCRFSHRPGRPETASRQARLRWRAQRLRLQTLVPGTGTELLRIRQYHRAVAQNAARNRAQIKNATARRIVIRGSVTNYHAPNAIAVIAAKPLLILRK